MCLSDINMTIVCIRSC